MISYAQVTSNSQCQVSFINECELLLFFCFHQIIINKNNTQTCSVSQIQIIKEFLAIQFIPMPRHTLSRGYNHVHEPSRKKLIELLKNITVVLKKCINLKEYIVYD